MQTPENLKQAYIAALQLEGVPFDLSSQCADVLVNDQIRDRTTEEQDLVSKAWRIANGLEEEDIADMFINEQICDRTTEEEDISVWFC